VKSTVTFRQYFYENNTVGDALGGSSGGFSPDNISGSDFYAPGDTRIPKGGATLSRKGLVKRKRRRKSKRSRKSKR
jgi:hypothetical protein